MNKKMMTIGAILIILLLILLPVISSKETDREQDRENVEKSYYGTDDGKVYGYVTEKGEPVVNEKVSIWDKDCRWVDYTRHTYTNNTGYYEFNDVPCNKKNPDWSYQQAKFYVNCCPVNDLLWYCSDSETFEMAEEGMEIMVNLEIECHLRNSKPKHLLSFISEGFPLLNLMLEKLFNCIERGR